MRKAIDIDFLCVCVCGSAYVRAYFPGSDGDSVSVGGSVPLGRLQHLLHPERSSSCSGRRRYTLIGRFVLFPSTSVFLILLFTVMYLPRPTQVQLCLPGKGSQRMTSGGASTAALVLRYGNPMWYNSHF